MALTMTQKQDIRNEFFCKGKNISEISRETEHDRKTVRDIICCNDWNIPKLSTAEKEKSFPKLAPFKKYIDAWLQSDKKERKKQRHTAKRIFDRLSKEEKETCDIFNCSYRTVADYVKKKKKEIYGNGNDVYLPLEHSPGESQADFGTAAYFENDKRVDEGKYINLSFPHSNQGFTQLFPGENTECLFEGMVNIFNHIGGVPPEIWFDNMSTAVKTILTGGNRNLTERFERFKMHYGFRAVFCNPNAGHEKGSVENKVGYHRRNMFVPVPKFKSIKEYNQQLLEKCDNDSNRDHYRLETEISELFKADKAHLLSLPANEFDTAGYLRVKTNPYAIFTLDKGIHEYSTAPRYANKYVMIKLTSTQVIVLDDSGDCVVVHNRIYGNKRERSMEWIPYLEQLSKRPRALKYSGIYEMLPNKVTTFLNGIENSEVGKVISMLAKITKQTSWENAVTTVNRAVENSTGDPDSIQTLHRRLFMNLPDIPALNEINIIPKVVEWVPDLTIFDALTSKGGTVNVQK